MWAVTWLECHIPGTGSEGKGGGRARRSNTRVHHHLTWSRKECLILQDLPSYTWLFFRTVSGRETYPLVSIITGQLGWFSPVLLSSSHASARLVLFSPPCRQESHGQEQSGTAQVWGKMLLKRPHIELLSLVQLVVTTSRIGPCGPRPLRQWD